VPKTFGSVVTFCSLVRRKEVGVEEGGRAETRKSSHVFINVTEYIYCFIKVSTSTVSNRSGSRVPARSAGTKRRRVLYCFIKVFKDFRIAPSSSH